MFTIDVILGLLKKLFGSVLSLLWEYKYAIIIGLTVTFLYIRGNGYKEDYQAEIVEHNKTVLQYEQTLNEIRLANEVSLREAKEKSLEDYKTLVEKTSQIQEKYHDREKDITNTITKLNSSNNSLQQTISNYTKRNSNSNESVLSDSSCPSRLSVLGELLGEAKQEEQYYATEAQKLSNSVNTLKTWSDIVIDSNRGVKNDVK